MTTTQDHLAAAEKHLAAGRITLARSEVTRAKVRDTGHGALWAQQWIAEQIEEAKK